MLSVVISTKDVERALVPTLAALVPGAAAGVVREVIIADGGSRDQSREVGDIAGCRVMLLENTHAERLSAAAVSARSPWLMFLHPGIVLDATWIDETAQFMENVERSGGAHAAVFRPASQAGLQRSVLREFLSLVRMSVGWRPQADQGLLIPKAFYQSLGGHSGPAPEDDLFHRLGRRRITVLRSAATRASGPV